MAGTYSTSMNSLGTRKLTKINDDSKTAAAMFNLNTSMVGHNDPLPF